MVLPRKSLLHYIVKNNSARYDNSLSHSCPTEKRYKNVHVTPTTWLIIDAIKYDAAFLEAIVAAQRTVFKLGIGKTVYALKTLSKIYGSTWSMVKDYIVFMPQEFLSILERLIDRNERIPAMLWDDAGFWLGRQRWMNKFVIAVREHLNVIRTHIVCIMFTAPKFKELAKGIRDNVDTITMVRLHVPNEDPRKRISYARCYYGLDEDSLFWRRERPSPWAEYYFTVYWKDYPLYLEKRKQYVEIGYTKLKSKLKEIAEEAVEEFKQIVSKHDAPRKKDDIIDVEELAEHIDLNDLKELWGY